MNNNLKRRIMARIYFEYTKNAFLEYPDYFMFALFVVTAFMLVSIRDVLVNIPKDDLPHAFNFLLSAFKGTSVIIQIMVAGFFIRVIVGTGILAYKNITTSRWSLSKLIQTDKV